MKKVIQPFSAKDTISVCCRDLYVLQMLYNLGFWKREILFINDVGFVCFSKSESIYTLKKCLPVRY